MSTLDLSTLSGQEIAVAVRAGKCDTNSVVAHLANRALPMDQLLPVVQLLPLDMQSAVMLAQMAMMQKKPAASKMAAVRATVSASGKRIVCVQPPKDKCPSGYTMTNPPASWLWILDNAAVIREACEKAAAITNDEVTKAVADKLVKKAQTQQTAFERTIATSPALDSIAK